MLTPHDGENAEFGEVGLASEDGFDAFVFVGRDAVFGDDFGCDGGHIGRIFNHGGHGEHGGEEEVSNGKAFDAAFEERDIEVDQEARSDVGEFQVGEDLGCVDGEELVDGFEFHQDFVFDDEVGAETTIEVEAFVADGNFLLRGGGETSVG
jgi:hypothetical protein